MKKLTKEEREVVFKFCRHYHTSKEVNYEERVKDSLGEIARDYYIELYSRKN